MLIYDYQMNVRFLVNFGLPSALFWLGKLWTQGVCYLCNFHFTIMDKSKVNRALFLVIF